MQSDTLVDCDLEVYAILKEVVSLEVETLCPRMESVLKGMQHVSLLLPDVDIPIIK